MKKQLPLSWQAKLASLLFVLLLLHTSVGYLQAQQILWPTNTGDGTVSMVFQRDAANKASVRFIVASANGATINSCQVRYRKYTLNGSLESGYVDPRPGSASLNNGYLNGVNFSGINSSCQVSFTLDIKGGMYQMEALVNGSQTWRDFGVGEVFAIAGQSNAAGYAKDNNGEAEVTAPKFVQYNNTKTQFDSNDPGSASVGRKYYKYYWGKLGSQLAMALNVPIAFYQAAWSGTSVHTWYLSSIGTPTAYPSGYPYQNLKAILQTTKNQVGLRGVLWHQGETYDTGNYNDELNALIQQSRNDAGGDIPWVIARTSYINGSAQAAIINSQNRLLTPNIYGNNFVINAKAFGDNTTTVYNKTNIFSGPETDGFTGTNRLPDQTHFSVQGQGQVANAWYTALTQTYGGQNFFSYPTALLNTQATTVNSTTCGPSNCNLSSAVLIGSWNGYAVELRQLGAYRALVTVVPGGPNGANKYFPRGKNYWNSINRNAGTDGYYNCINVGETGFGGLVFPSEVTLPAGYAEGYEQDGARYFYQSNQPIDICELTQPQTIGTWSGYTVQLRKFDGYKVLVTVVPGGPNGAVKYFARGKNYWNSINRNAGTDAYYNCINVGETGFGGLVLPFDVNYTPAGYLKGTENDGAIYYYQSSGGRLAAPEVTIESVEPMVIAPNPSTGTFTVQVNVANEQPAELIVRNLQGMVWFRKPFIGKGKQSHAVVLGSSAKGMALVSLETNGKMITSKVIILP